MIARRLPNGNLLIPIRADSEGVQGDASLEIAPDHPDYERWLRDLELGWDAVAIERAAIERVKAEHMASRSH
jgi:hypothetical protein